MRRFLLTLGFAAALSSPAAAQYPAGPTNQSSLALTAPTPASVAESSNRIATTAWVNNYVNAGLPLASGKIWIGSVGNIAVAQTMSGDGTLANGGAFTLATVNANVGSFGSVTQCATITVNAKGLITGASAATCTPAVGSVTGLGTGVATFLGTPSSANLRGALTDETGTGLAYFQGGDIGTPSAGVATNLTGTATGLTSGGFSAGTASNLNAGTLLAARMPALTGDCTTSAGAVAVSCTGKVAGVFGQLPGETSTGNASTGNVGEYVSSTVLLGSAVSFGASPANVDITSISLTAGDWECSGNAALNPAGTTTMSGLFAWISTTSATLPTTPNSGAEAGWNLPFTTGLTQIIPIGSIRVSISVTTTVFLSARAAYGVSTLSAYGHIHCRRAR